MTHRLPQSCERAGPSPDHESVLRQRDALLQLQSGAAHLRNKVPVEAGTFDQPVAEDTALANEKDRPNIVDSGEFEGKFPALRLRDNIATHNKGGYPPAKGAAQGSRPSKPTRFRKEKVSARSYCSSKVLLALL